MTNPARAHLHLHPDAADGIARRLSEQEDTIVRLAEENARLKARIEMLDIANAMQSQETAKARKRADALASMNGRLTQKLIAYHAAQRTPEQNESAADAMAQAQEFHDRDMGRDDQ